MEYNPTITVKDVNDKKVRNINLIDYDNMEQLQADLLGCLFIDSFGVPKHFIELDNDSTILSVSEELVYLVDRVTSKVNDIDAFCVFLDEEVIYFVDNEDTFQVIDIFHDSYRGEQDLKEYIEEYIKSCGNIPTFILDHLDWNKLENTFQDDGYREYGEYLFYTGL